MLHPAASCGPESFWSSATATAGSARSAFKPVERGLEWPHPFSRSQEHTIPRSRDGVDDASNIRLAHLLCNQWKWARTDEEILGMTPPQPGEYDPVVMEMISQAKRAVLSARALGRPWPPGQREQFILSMSEVWGSPEYRASLVDGQARRRAAEKAGERPMFSEEGLKQSLANFAMSWTGEGHEKALAKSAEVRRARVKDVANEMWAARAARGLSGSCSECGGTDSKPIAKGLCTACYMKKPKPPKLEDGSKRRPGTPKLTEEIVRIIRAEWAYGKSRELAERFGVSVSLIQDVANGKRWSHVA